MGASLALLQTDRELRLWEYAVSLRQLLLRSPKLESGYANNLDVIFVGVRYMEIPVTFKGLTITSGTPIHRRKVEQLLGKAVPLTHIFLLESQSRTHLIVAGMMRVEENLLDIRESSLEFSPNEAVKRRDDI